VSSIGRNALKRFAAVASVLLLLLPALSGCGRRSDVTWPEGAGDFVPPTSERAIGRTSSSGTLPDPSPVTPYVPSEDGFKRIYEDASMVVTFKEARDIFHIQDKRNGYVWSTGIDAGYRQEDQMNKTFAAYANSFLTFEYFDQTRALAKVSSTQIEADGETDLSTLTELGEGVFLLSVDTGADGFAAEATIRFGNGSMKVSIDPASILERSPDKALAGIYIAPFLGAVGGRMTVEDTQAGTISKKDKMPGYDGYLFVPDGPGALIRFRTNPVAYSVFNQAVFGEDPGSAYRGTTLELHKLDPARQSIPLFGVAIGDGQAAFAAYATAGAENMEILASPRGTTTLYHYVAGRFVFRRIFYRVLNQQGDGFDTYPEKADIVPIGMTYDFLSGGDADYVGMACTYRDSLISREILDGTVLPEERDVVRIDVLMADVKKWVFGYKEVPMTTAGELSSILDDLGAAGIGPVSMNLYGYSKNGLNAQDPSDVAFDPETANRSELQALAERLADDGGQLSFGQDYSVFTKAQATPQSSAVMNVGVVYANRAFRRTKPVFDLYYFTKPKTMVAWFERQSRILTGYGFTGLTMDGLASELSSDFPSSGATRRSDALALVVQAMKDAKALGATLDARSANEYAFPYLSRLTDTPMFHSQYLIETDTVPVLPIVLSGSVSLYSPYVNFSYYTKADILRMIDYGVRPSFLVTGESSYLLSRTNSNDLYSTGYASQRAMIRIVGGMVEEALSTVKDARIVDRSVPAADVALVTYDNEVRILINYGLKETTYEGRTIGPQDFAVFGG